MSALGDALSHPGALAGAERVSVAPKAIAAAREALEPSERPMFEQRLREMSAEEFAAVLTAAGFVISGPTVLRYRRALRRQEASQYE